MVASESNSVRQLVRLSETVRPSLTACLAPPHGLGWHRPWLPPVAIVTEATGDATEQQAAAQPSPVLVVPRLPLDLPTSPSAG